jgi:ribosomal protein L11 methylase PrmA
MLGAGSVTGFDIDEEALETAAENIQVGIFLFFLCVF